VRSFLLVIIFAFVSCGNEEKSVFRFSLQPKNVPAETIERMRDIFQEFNSHVGYELVYFCRSNCTGTVEFSDLEDQAMVGLCTPLQNNVTRSSFDLKEGFKTRKRREFHANFKFSNKLLTTPDNELFRVVVLHELGHALGFGHSQNVEDIMHPFVNGKKNFTVFFQSSSNWVGQITH
jgi:hypothetical protein